MPETSAPLRILSRLSAVPAFCDLIFRGARASLYKESRGETKTALRRALRCRRRRQQVSSGR